MRLLDKYEGIKVVTICPGAVDSPLWDEDKRERTKFNSIESLKPDEVAKAMIDLVRSVASTSKSQRALTTDRSKKENTAAALFSRSWPTTVHR